MTRDNDGMLSAFGITAAHCGCAKCVGEVLEARPFPQNMMWPFIVCALCGNKRCPKASWHGFQCGRSNEPGQTAIPEVVS